MMLIHKLPTSMDQAVELIRAITDDAIDLPKSSLVNWSNTLSEKFSHLIEEIRQGLHNATYVHTDESPININGKTYQLHNYSNDQYTLQYIHQRKSKEAMEELGFLPNYLGTLIHDHNKVQYNFGIKHSECNAHEEDERRLINRLEDYKAIHLLFMYDFKIPFTNNRAETDIRPTKRKLNVGIFRSEDSAKDYVQIRSCLSTFMKNNLNIFQKIKDVFAGKSLSLIVE